MSSKLLIALLAVIVVAAGAGVYIAFADDHPDNGKDTDDSGPGGDDPSDSGTDDPSQPGTDDPGTDTPDVPGPSSFEFQEQIEPDDWISQTITGTWFGEPVQMDVVYQVRYVFEHDAIFDIIAESNGSFEALDIMQSIQPSMFEIIPTVIIDEIPYYFEGLDTKNDSDSATTGSIYMDPIGKDVVGTPRGNVSCDHYRVEGTAYGVDVTFDVWYYPGTFLPSRIVADYGGNVLTLICDSNLLIDGSGNGPTFEPELPPAPSQDTEFTLQYRDESNIFGLCIVGSDATSTVGTIEYNLEINENGHSAGSGTVNWEWGDTNPDPFENAFEDMPWFFTIGEKPDVSNATSLGKELVRTYLGDLLCDHYTMSYNGTEMEWWNYSGTGFIAVMELTDDSGTDMFFYITDRLVESTDGGSDTPQETTGEDRTFAFGEPQVDDWISGNMTEESNGTTLESTITIKVTAIEGDTMTVEVGMTGEDTPAFEPEVLEGVPTSVFGTFPLVYLVGVGEGGSVEPELVGSEVTDASRGDVLCDHYNLAGILDYYIISGTDFVAKMVVSNEYGTGTFMFDSNKLIETA